MKRKRNKHHASFILQKNRQLREEREREAIEEEIRVNRALIRASKKAINKILIIGGMKDA